MYGFPRSSASASSWTWSNRRRPRSGTSYM
jgi:hypothetical protein